VPTSWDETRVLAGDIGEYIVIARRAGDAWYVGAMTNERGRRVTIPLDFLGQGTFAAKIYADGRDINSLAVSEKAVTGRSRLTLKLADHGGGVIVIRPQPPRPQ
jgi:alpha-glucosidase